MGDSTSSKENDVDMLDLSVHTAKASDLEDSMDTSVTGDENDKYEYGRKVDLLCRIFAQSQSYVSDDVLRAQMKRFQDLDFSAISCIESTINDVLFSLSAAIPDCNPVREQSEEGVSEVLNIPEVATVRSSRVAKMFSLLMGIGNSALKEAANSFLQTYERDLCHSTISQTFAVMSLILQGFISRVPEREAAIFLYSKLYRQELNDKFIKDFLDFCTSNGVFAAYMEAKVMHDEVVLQNMRVLSRLVSLKLATGSRPFCELIVSRRDFLPELETEGKGREIQARSFLGPFLAYGIYCDEGNSGIATEYFDMESMMKTGASASIFAPYQNRIANARREMFSIVHALVVDGKSRSTTLQYIANVIDLNDKRLQLHADFSLLASHMFMINLTWVLYELSVKIGVEKVNAYYPLLSTCRLKTEKTRLNLDSKQLTDFEEHIRKERESSEGEKFTTECFFLTMAGVSVSVISTMRRMKALKDRIGQYNDRKRDIQKQLASGALTGPQKLHGENELKRTEKKIARLGAVAMTLDCVSRDPAIAMHALDFSDKQLTLLCNAISPQCVAQHYQFSGKEALPDQPPQLFIAYPEYFMEDTLDILSNLLNHKGTFMLVLEKKSLWPDQLMMLLYCRGYCKKMDLASKMIQVIAMVSPVLQSAALSIWNQMILGQTARQLFVPALIEFYSDCEEGDFYSKYMIRRNIQMIFQSLWQMPFFCSEIIKLAKAGGPEFIRFVNMIINDTTFLLDESLGALKKIHDIESLMDRREEWAALSQEDRQAKEGALMSAERDVKSWLWYGNDTLDMLGYMTGGVSEPFLTDVLGDRLASMLNHNLLQLCGKKCTELKVKEAETRFNWRPRELTSKVVQIYINLASEKFATFIAHDERSYTPTAIKEAIVRLSTSSIVSSSYVERFRALAEVVEQRYNAKAQDEMDLELDDAPEEFKDPVMATLMVDPVLLPSGHVMDRKHIMRHLLSNSNNPFNRAPLTVDQLEPMPELKTRIRDWVKEKLAK